MIYKTLDVLPYKLFLKILETDNYKLLSTKFTFKKLKPIWEKLKNEYQLLYLDNDDSNYVSTSAKIARLESEYLATLIAIKVLANKFSPEMLDILKSYHYKIDENNYLDKLQKIQKESEGLLITIKELVKALPKNDKNAQNIDKLIIAYNDGNIVDTNKITVTQFLGLQQLFSEKVKAIEAQTKKTKNGIR